MEKVWAGFAFLERVIRSPDKNPLLPDVRRCDKFLLLVLKTSVLLLWFYGTNAYGPNSYTGLPRKNATPMITNFKNIRD